MARTQTWSADVTDETLFGITNSLRMMDTEDRDYTFNIPFATDFVYNVHFNLGLDWTHLAIESSTYLKDVAD
jgi:hypothetical protein